MTKPVAAPEIFQIPLDQLDPAIVPPSTKPGTPEFEQAVIMHYALRYADKGWQATVTVNDGFVRVLAIPQQGMDPKDKIALRKLFVGSRSAGENAYWQVGGLRERNKTCSPGTVIRTTA